LKQLFVDAIRQVLLEMPIEPTTEISQRTTASLLTDLLEVFQATPSSAGSTGHPTSASVGVEKDNYLHLSCDIRGGTPPNSPCVTPSEPGASDCNVSENPNSSVTLKDVEAATLQNFGPLNDGQSTPNKFDMVVTNGERLVAGARVPNVEDKKTCEV
jgi:hypothetical protein